MTSTRDERPRLEHGEEGFVESLTAEYAPSPMSAAQRAAFDETLRARLERPRRRWLLAPAFAGATAAAALIWLAVAGPTGPVGIPGGEGSGREIAGSWEDELFLSSEVSGSEDRVESGALPDDYLAIASLLIDG
jgi:hypothetical protein